MKTTIELPDALASRAKKIAREHHLTLRELVTDGLRAELDRFENPPHRAEFRFHSRGGEGLRPGVTPDSLTTRGYDLPG
ncbi:MAG: hypothetical protein ABI873_01695 [Marmoricola sp.]